MPSAALPSGATPAALSRRRVAFALALLLGLQPVTTDVYMPALPMVTRALAAPMASVQLTMSAVILAFGLAQMVWGPWADRVGRRPVLLLGLALYSAASLGATLAGSIELLVIWRALQGAALGAAVVCARAIVRDLNEPAQGAQLMALALSGLGVMALIAPVLGGLSAAAWGWRAPLALVTAIGLATLAFVALCLPETLRQPRAPRESFGALLRLWRNMGLHPVFVAWALLVACSYGGLFTLLAASAFVYIGVLGLSPAVYGAAMAVGSLCYLLGTFVCRGWIARWGTAATVHRGAWATLAAGLAFAALAAWGVKSPWAVLLPQCLFAFGHGIHQPCGQAGVVGPFPQAAGAASALAGLVLALVAFGVGLWLGGALDGTVRPLACGMALWSALTCACAWRLVPRLRR